MDLLLKARGARITDRLREVAEHKLARLGRMEPRLTRLEIEMTVEAVRYHVGVTVVKTPFFNPPRKTATPPAPEPSAAVKSPAHTSSLGLIAESSV